MGDLFTVNKNIAMPVPGTENNTWGADLNTNSWPVIDTAFGGYTQINVTGIGAGAYALSATQYTPPNIVFSGTLGANLTYYVPTGVGGTWSVFNNTTGAFQLAFQSGNTSFIAVPQGQRAFLICDGVNMQYAQTGGAQAGNPTAVVGTSAINGVDTTYMRSDAAPAIDQSMSPAWSGIHNFNNMVNINGGINIGTGETLTLLAGSLLSGTSGSITVPTQAPGNNSTAAASTAFVTAAAAAALISPHFTGIPTAPTATSGTSTTQLASTAFVNPAGTLAGNGYVKLASGLIIQWGAGGFLSTGTALTFATNGIAFPNACFVVLVCPYGAAATSYVSTFSATGFTAINGNNTNLTWIAIGN